MRVGERGALVHAVADLAEDALEARVLDLLGQRREALDERDAGADQRRELARREREVERRDAAQEREVEARPPRLLPGASAVGGGRGALGEVGQEDAVAAQLGARGARALRVDEAARGASGLRDSLVGVDGQGGRLERGR